MTFKTLIFNFDGTGNEPRDAEQFSSEHFKEDASISNILKLHLLFGGQLENQPSTPFENQLSFYYQGIGTKGSQLKRVLNQVLAPHSDDVASILNQARDDFKAHYQPGDTLLLTGFSRGAALARRFAKCLEPLINDNIYLCVFDTVASIGLSKLRKATRGADHVIFENHTIARNVKAALHCVSFIATVTECPKLSSSDLATVTLSSMSSTIKMLRCTLSRFASITRGEQCVQ